MVAGIRTFADANCLSKTGMDFCATWHRGFEREEVLREREGASRACTVHRMRQLERGQWAALTSFLAARPVN